MKHTLILVILIILPVAGNLYPQSTDSIYEQPSFLPSFADTEGMGGAFTVSHGFSSLFYNPAGFASDDASLTIVSAGLWSAADIFTMAGLYGASAETKETILSDYLLNGGYGTGFSAGLGLVLGGLGIGMFLDMDTMLEGESSIADAAGYHTTTLGFVIGYAYEFKFSGISLSIGADVRPMARIYVPLSGSSASDVFGYFTGSGSGSLFQALGSAPALYGPGLAFDSGMIADIGDFSFGFSLRDIGNTRFFYNQSTFDKVITSFTGTGLFPEDGSSVSGIYQIPMNLGVGFSYHPDMGDLSKVIDPEIHLDFQDILRYGDNENLLLSLIKIGAQAKFLDMITLRSGFSNGCLSMGLGLQVLFFDVNTAFTVKVIDSSLGGIPQNYSLAEFAVRFKL